MAPMQQMFLGLGAAEKTYMDDIFSTYLYKGDGNSGRTITNNIDVSGQGALIWLKNRTVGQVHHLTDTVRGANKQLFSNNNNEQYSLTDRITGFTSSGFTIGDNSRVNNSGDQFSSWTFRKAPGFFDVVNWTGDNSSNRAISHSLESVPGLILVKALTGGAKEWHVWHRDQHGKVGVLDTTAAFFSNASRFPTAPTSTNFYIGNDSALNANSTDYVAYVFAGGESTASTARSTEFNGHSSEVHLTMSASTDLDMGTGDFTIEFWYKGQGYNTDYRQAIISSNTGWGSGFTQIQVNHPSHQNHIVLWDYDINSSNPVLKSTNTFPQNGTWRHVAISRSSGTLRMFVNGTLEKSATQTGSLDFSDSHGTMIGYYPNDIGLVGDISNLRVVKGTAVYTSSFKVPTAPLTNITNTKLLCCNNSHPAGKTVGPALTVTGTVTASTDSPFDDPAAFTFGDAGDQNVIKAGSWKGTGTSGLEVNIGFEPQWILFKNASAAYNWYILDTMRGIVSTADDKILAANDLSAEWDSSYLDVTPTGFKVQTTHALANNSGSTYIFLALRRLDVYVGKPAAAGTDVFAMDTGNGSSTIPAMDSGFPVDFALWRQHASTEGWSTGARLMGTKYVVTNTTATESHYANHVWDSNAGILKTDYASNYFAWMWKRYAGCDVVTGLEEFNTHNLGKTPEMVWIKRRDNASDWFVWHKGLNGGTNDGLGYNLRLNTNASQNSTPSLCPIGDQLPTATHFKTASDSDIRNSGSIAFLFASVSGISKVGYYAGSNSSQTITTGFQPRFLIIKLIDDSGGDWIVFDTTRGWGSGNDNYLRLNESSPQSSYDFGAPTSTGFTLVGNTTGINMNPYNFIYYAHA